MPSGGSVLREFGIELASVFPLISLLSLQRAGAKPRDFGLNLMVAALSTAAAAALTMTLGSPEQWIGLCLGLYAFLTWVQTLGLRDAPALAMIYRCRAVIYGEISFGWISFITYGLGFWMPPFFIRTHGVTAGEAGIFLGLNASVAGFIGAFAGGLLSDRLKRITPRARPYMGMGVVVAAAPLAIGVVTVPNVVAAYVLGFLYTACSAAWLGSAVALANELVLPRMRAAASAFYILCVTFVGLALGPYVIGRISDALSAMPRRRPCVGQCC